MSADNGVGEQAHPVFGAGMRWRWLWPLLIAVVAAGVYANTVECGFTWDDEWLILKNPRISDPSYVTYMLFQRQFWRPVKRTSLMVDEGIVYFGAGVFPAETVFLYAVEAASGKVIWKNDWISQRDAGRDDLSPQGYMLASDSGGSLPAG